MYYNHFVHYNHANFHRNNRDRDVFGSSQGSMVHEAIIVDTASMFASQVPWKCLGHGSIRKFRWPAGGRRPFAQVYAQNATSFLVWRRPEQSRGPSRTDTRSVATTTVTIIRFFSFDLPCIRSGRLYRLDIISLFAGPVW